MCVYVNKHGDNGPHLDRKLVQQLPDHFGPAPVNAVLQQAVQACVDCTFKPSVLLLFLQSQSHTGGEVIRGKGTFGCMFCLPKGKLMVLVCRKYLLKKISVLFKRNTFLIFIINYLQNMLLNNLLHVQKM